MSLSLRHWCSYQYGAHVVQATDTSGATQYSLQREGEVSELRAEVAELRHALAELQGLLLESRRPAGP